MEPIRLTTERLLMRSFAPEDTDAVYTACQDPEIQRWTIVPSPYTRADAELFTGKLCPAGWQDDTMYNFAVVLRDGGPLVGALGVSRCTMQGTYEVGFWTAGEHRGAGYTTEAVLAAARWTFSGLAADRLEWRAEIGNAPSRAVALRAGFRMEGEQRSGLVNKGTRRDSWAGALLPADLGLPGTLPYLPASAVSGGGGGELGVGEMPAVVGDDGDMNGVGVRVHAAEHPLAGDARCVRCCHAGGAFLAGGGTGRVGQTGH